MSKITLTYVKIYFNIVQTDNVSVLSGATIRTNLVLIKDYFMI